MRIDTDPVPFEEKAGHFFSKATIGDIYGRDVPNPRRIALTDEQFSRWIKNPPADIDARAERVAHARSKGIQWIDELNVHRYPIFSKEGPYYLTEARAPDLTHWFPHIEERRIILGLAKTLASKKTPFILEAACGSGIVSRALAVDGIASTVGIDPDMVNMGAERIPQTPGNTQFRNVDLWDAITEFSPVFSASITAQRNEFLDRVRSEYGRSPIFTLFCMGSACAQEGNPERVEDEVQELQHSAELAVEPSPIDLVLCSFMPRDVDLTIPIRDGVHPKAIIYVRPNTGMSGAGDFYVDGVFHSETSDEIQPDENAAISFNPGRNYRTVASWKTPCSNDWWSFVKPPHFRDRLETEVVIQLRNDIQITHSDRPVIQNFPFDEDFKKGFEDPNNYKLFMEGIELAKSNLGLK